MCTCLCCVACVCAYVCKCVHIVYMYVNIFKCKLSAMYTKQEGEREERD